MIPASSILSVLPHWRVLIQQNGLSVDDYIYIYIYIYMDVYFSYQLLCTNRMQHKVTFKRNLTGLNSEFSIAKTGYHTRVKEPSLPHFLWIAGGKIVGCIPSPGVLVLWEMQMALSSIWTRITISISYNVNHFTTNISTLSIISIVIRYFCIIYCKSNVVIKL